MPSLPTPVEMGFAEFVAKLVLETFDAVVSSQVEQERGGRELVDAASLAPEAYAERFLAAGAEDAELARLFPPPDETHPSAIFEKGPYQPATPATPEAPPVGAVLGLALRPEEDFAGKALTARGVERIRLAVRLRLAGDQVAALQRLVARGFPRIVVDSGRISAKLTFQVTQESPARAGVRSPRASAPAPGRRLLPAYKLTVRQADERSPQAGQLKVDVFGEVEVTFKTVT